MARITISLPDELKAQLDASAEKQGISVSEVAQHALQKLFNTPQNPTPAPTNPSPPTPIPSPPPASNQDTLERLARLEKYVASLAYESEAMRQGLGSVSAYFQQQLFLAVPCPPPIEPPTWQHVPPLWMHYKIEPIK